MDDQVTAEDALLALRAGMLTLADALTMAQVLPTEPTMVQIAERIRGLVDIKWGDE